MIKAICLTLLSNEVIELFASSATTWQITDRVAKGITLPRQSSEVIDLVASPAIIWQRTDRMAKGIGLILLSNEVTNVVTWLITYSSRTTIWQKTEQLKVLV